MLNISLISISKDLNLSKYKSYKNLQQRTGSTVLLKILTLLFIIGIASMFLPWTQNIRSKGKVTTLNPFDKPQNIQALVGGKIDQWYVTEGDLVEIGDTIVILTEAKSDYLDPELLANTKEQEMAKTKSAAAYLTKSNILKEQRSVLKDYRDSKLNQIKIKQQQLTIEVVNAEQDLEAANTYAENASKQLTRMQLMYDQGIKSLTDLEAKKLAEREAIAKKTSALNKLNQIENKRINLQQEIILTNNDYQQKVAKIESDIRSADSYRYSLQGETSKLRSKFNQIENRQSAFLITSPVAGRITKVLVNGIGEYVKAQQNIATIVPTDYQKAVELYIEPNDMPLVQVGKNVRLQFDGWPAVVFSGWPDNSFGTFAGKLYAIDNQISENGRYRIIVIEDKTNKPWPDLIRIGSGAKGLLLLKDVKVYYEIWRKLNGFPPDFYQVEQSEKIKNKAPIKKVK